VESGPVKVVRGLLVTVLATASLLLTTVAAPAPAQASEPVALLSITLTSLKPTLPTRDGTISVTGRVTNITKDRLYRLQAIFWRNQAPITTREGMDQALSSASNDPLGARLYQRDFQDLYTTADPYLEPGKSVDFSLKVRVRDLELSPTDGVYLMGVHVLQNGNPVAIGRARLFVPIVGDEPPQALRMTSIVVLSSRPSLIRKGVLVDDHLAGEVAAGGRLTALLGAADSARTSFAVDPALIQELQTMKDGYQVQTADGTRAGTGQADATRWLQDFAQTKAARDGYQLLYGSPDLAALVHGGLTAALQDAVTAARQVDLTSSLPLLVLPAGGAVDAAMVKAAAALHPKAIVTADTSTAAGAPLLAGPDGIPLVTFTATAFGGGPGPDPRDTPVQLQQRLLADTWIEATTSDDGSAHGRVRLVTTAAQARGSDAGGDAPWLQRSTLTELLQSTPRKWEGKYRYPASARDAELDGTQLNSLRSLSVSARTYADLLVDGTAAKAAGSAAVARAASANWRGKAEARETFLGPQQSSLDDVLLDKIQISSTAKVRTIALKGVEFPITIKNLLPGTNPPSDENAVKVKLVFVSDNTQRLAIKTITSEPIRAGENYTVNAQVTAKANGIVPVRAQLTTLTGRPVGRSFTIDVQVTQNGTTGWVIALAAGLVLVGTTTLRIRQVARERARAPRHAAPESGAPTPVTALTSAPPVDQPHRDQSSPNGRSPGRSSPDPSSETLDV
jgi:hypothetical protein